MINQCKPIENWDKHDKQSQKMVFIKNNEIFTHQQTVGLPNKKLIWMGSQHGFTSKNVSVAS